MCVAWHELRSETWNVPARANIFLLDIAFKYIISSPPTFSFAFLQFAVEGIVKSRKRKGRDEVEYLVDWEGYGEADRTWEPEAAFADGGDEVLAAFRKRRRKEGHKQKQKQGGDNGGAAPAAAEESAVQVGREPVDGAALPQKQKVKTCRVQGCTSYAVARGVCRTHASAKQTRQLCYMPCLLYTSPSPRD